MTRNLKALLIPPFVALGLIGTAAAQETTEVPITDSPVSSSVLSLDYFAPRYQNVKWDTHRIRDDKCRDHSKPHLWPWARQVAAHYRDERLAIVRTWKARARDRSSRCLPTSMAGIIRYVFPAATENAAVSVASCESGLSPTAYNSSSGAAGLFQFLPMWYAGNWNPFDPWANTRMAYKLSDAGYNWAHWVCKP